MSTIDPSVRDPRGPALSTEPLPEEEYRRIIRELHDRALRAEAERDRLRDALTMLAGAVVTVNKERGTPIAQRELTAAWKAMNA